MSTIPKSPVRLRAVRSKPGESYESYRKRQLRVIAEHADYLVMWTCLHAGGSVNGHGRHYLRAFYGVEMRYILPELFP